MRRKGIEWDTGNNSAQAIAALLPDTKRVSNPITEPGPGLAVPVAFERGTATVSKASLAYIEPIAAALREDMSLRLVIEGHADALGNPRTNAMLSWERAFSVFRVLVDRYGIDAQRLQPLGKGSSEPLRPDDPTHAANRRVQFRVTGTLPA
jgi:outer membrane protein OmpA-like peptidoglycan-associated protein